MLYHSSNLFWGSEIIRKLGKAEDLFNRFVESEPAALPELLEFHQGIESPVLDAVRIMVCFENYFKAKLLLEGYVIHQMDLNVCREHYPQFTTGKTRRRLLQRTIPISIDEIKHAENHKGHSIEPLRTLTKRTIGMSTLLGESRYRAIYLDDQATDDQQLFAVLNRLNQTRNTLHFLNAEYIASGGQVAPNLVFLHDYVLDHIDALGNKIGEESKSELKAGEEEVHNILPSSEEHI
jgi:hypothetical protein